MKVNVSCQNNPPIVLIIFSIFGVFKMKMCLKEICKTNIKNSTFDSNVYMSQFKSRCSISSVRIIYFMARTSENDYYMKIFSIKDATAPQSTRSDVICTPNNLDKKLKTRCVISEWPSHAHRSLWLSPKCQLPLSPYVKCWHLNAYQIERELRLWNFHGQVFRMFRN